MRTHNRPMPDFIPDAQVVFDPSSEKGIQMETAPTMSTYTESLVTCSVLQLKYLNLHMHRGRYAQVHTKYYKTYAAHTWWR